MEQPPAKRSREEPAQAGKAGVYEGTNGVPRAGTPGRVLHLGLADGELAARVVAVGHHARAELLAKFLEPEQPGGSVFRLASDRGFLTFTGTYMGTRVSIVSVGMGLAMMDFFAREARAVVKGPMAVVRLGTCGCLKKSVPVGSICVATEGSILVQRNISAFAGSREPKEEDLNGDHPYLISEPCLSDRVLSAAVLDSLQRDLGAGMALGGLNVTADSFYGSQGRLDHRFVDANRGLIAEVLRRHPGVVTMEMETFQLLHLAQSCRPMGDMRAAAAVVIVANRSTGEVVSEEALKAAERNGGSAILRALVGLPL